MKISEFIKELQEYLEDEGDLEILECNDDGEWYEVHPYPEDKENFFGNTSYLPDRFIYLS